MEMKKLPKRIFYTGVPGSGWSRMGYIVEDVLGLNISDRDSEREFGYHRGMYYGESMLIPADLDRVDEGRENTEGSYLVKSHEWVDMFEEIEYRYPDDAFLVIYSDNKASEKNWYMVGGFKIEYPNYDSYIDSETMYKRICQDNESINFYVKQRGVEFSSFTHKWFKETFNADSTHWDSDTYFYKAKVAYFPARRDYA